MSDTVHYTACPVCDSKDIHPLHAVKDYTVSKQEFVIWQCARCTLRFTQDVPDETSIGPYYQSDAYISHTNASKGLMNSLYQKVRSFTLEQKRRLIQNATGKKEGRLLDVGCGTGAFLQHMQQHRWKVEGVEPDEGARRQAEKALGKAVATPDALPGHAPRSFDAITLWHVLEHVHHLHPYVDNLKQLLAAGGRLFIAVPNYQSWEATVYRLNWAAYDVPRHLYHFTPKAIEALLSKHGLKLVAKKPMWFDAFYIALLSSKYRHGGKANWIGAGFTGAVSNLRALLNNDKCSSLIYVVEKA